VGFALLLLGLAGHLVRYALRGIDFRRLRRDLLETIAVRLLRGFAFAFFGLIILFPFWYMLSASLKGRADMLRDPANLAIEWGQGVQQLLVGYREVLITFDFLNFIGNSFLVAFVTMTVTLVMAVLGAYAITRLAFPGRTFLARSILLIYMFPAIVLVIPLYAVFTQLGLRDTLPGLLIVYPATTIPVALYMLRSYFQTLPKDLEEAGLIDGCTRAQVIWRITLPLAMPAIASVGLYVFMIAWNEFLFAFMFLDDPGIFTLPRGMVMLDSQEVPRQYLMAGAMIITVPIMILFFWFEKYLVGGLTAGGVKG
jgi:multiple sugar transport system permease protein